MTALTPRQPLGLLSNFTDASVQSLARVGQSLWYLGRRRLQRGRGDGHPGGDGSLFLREAGTRQPVRVTPFHEPGVQSSVRRGPI